MHPGHAHAGLHHGHSHAPSRETNRNRLTIALVINLALVVAGVIGTVAFKSLALFADAGHILSDVGAIALAMFAAAMAARPASGRRTFGFYRTEILAALANGLILVLVAVLVFVEGVMRLSSPSNVDGLGVLIIGVVGLVGNVGATVALAGGDREDINLEAVLRHSAGDALGSLGVVVSGALVLAFGWDRADPIAGMVIGVLILLSSWRLIKEPIDVLMEAAPEGVDVQEIGIAMAAVEGRARGARPARLDGHLGLPGTGRPPAGGPGARPRRGPPRGRARAAGALRNRAHHAPDHLRAAARARGPPRRAGLSACASGST